MDFRCLMLFGSCWYNGTSYLGAIFFINYTLDYVEDEKTRVGWNCLVTCKWEQSIKKGDLIQFKPKVQKEAEEN